MFVTYPWAVMMEGSIGMKLFSFSVLVSGQQLTQIKTFRVRIRRHVERITLALVQQHKGKCNQTDLPPWTMLFSLLIGDGEHYA